MYPAILDGDELSISLFEKPRRIEQIDPGHVVLLKLDQEWAIHRVVEASGRRFAKGDWALLPDEVTEAWGVVSHVNGRTGRFFHSPLLAKLSRIDLYSKGWLIRKLRKIIFASTVFLLKSW